MRKITKTDCFKFIRVVAGMLIIAALSTLAVFLFKQQDSSNISLFGDFSIAISYIPVLLIAGLYGYLI
nr:hypothetical protein [Lachnospiraceae bacterium]